jgi:hypothetical protein
MGGNVGTVEVSVIADPLKPFPPKSFVVHPNWGKGMVVRYDRNKIVVAFDVAGYKTFVLDVVVKQGLLKAVGGYPHVPGGSAREGPR